MKNERYAPAAIAPNDAESNRDDRDRWEPDAERRSDRDDDDEARQLGDRDDPEAAEVAPADRCHDVGRAPAERGDQAVVESERHPPSLRAGGALDGVVRCARQAGVLSCYTLAPVGALRRLRGDVAQLEEHRVRIAGVRGSSPLISTTSVVEILMDRVKASLVWRARLAALATVVIAVIVAACKGGSSGY